MNIQTQNNAELIQLSKLIADMHVCMLTNHDHNGALVSKPMSPLEMDSNGAIWFITDIRFDNASNGINSHDDNGKSIGNLSFSNESNSTYVSISGHYEISTNRVDIKRLWTAFAKPWFPDGPESDDLALLKFVPNTAEYWDAPHSRVVRLFAMAASIIASKPIGLGEHKTLVNLSQTSGKK